MMMSTAVVVTDSPSRYAKQLLSHLGHKVTVEPLADQPAPAGRLVFGYGTGTVVPRGRRAGAGGRGRRRRIAGQGQGRDAASPGEVRRPSGIDRQLGTGGLRRCPRGRISAAESATPTAGPVTVIHTDGRRRTPVRSRRPSRPAAGSTCRPCSVPIRSGTRSRRTPRPKPSKSSPTWWRSSPRRAPISPTWSGWASSCAICSETDRHSTRCGPSVSATTGPPGRP